MTRERTATGTAGRATIVRVRTDDLTRVESRVWQAFAAGDLVDLAGARSRRVRAEVVAALLLGAEPARPGALPALRLTGARIAGKLMLSHADIGCVVAMGDCEFEEAIDLTGARTRELSLAGSRLAGIDATLAQIGGALDLSRCVCDGQVRLVGANIAGRLLLSSATVNNPGDVALYASRLRVEDDVFSDDAVVTGEYRLAGARIGGALALSRAKLDDPGGHAFYASNLSVGAGLVARHGLSVNGGIALSNVSVADGLDLSGARLSNPGGDALATRDLRIGTFIRLGDGFTADGAVRLAYATARELVLRHGEMTGELDLRHARFEIIRDDPHAWPRSLNLAGLSYNALDPWLPAYGRLDWLARDTSGPDGYRQLAFVYRAVGDDGGAKTVLLAYQRRWRRKARWHARAWGWVQDVTVGYGYRPLRAAAWLCLLLAAGTTVFAHHHPEPIQGAARPGFDSFLYTLDLLVPLANLGQKAAYESGGLERWFAYALVAAGWLFATTIATALARVLRRE